MWITGRGNFLQLLQRKVHKNIVTEVLVFNKGRKFIPYLVQIVRMRNYFGNKWHINWKLSFSSFSCMICFISSKTFETERILITFQKTILIISTQQYVSIKKYKMKNLYSTQYYFITSKKIHRAKVMYLIAPKLPFWIVERCHILYQSSNKNKMTSNKMPLTYILQSHLCQKTDQESTDSGE